MREVGEPLEPGCACAVVSIRNRDVWESDDVPSNEVLLPETVKSIPVWRIAFPQVSPSIPTHAEAE